jgi:excisionase family DNA binding protein
MGSAQREPCGKVALTLFAVGAFMTIQSEWLTAEEAARHLKVKTRTLLLWVRQGKVKAFALSGTKRRVWRFRHQDLDAALVELPVLPSIPLSVRSERRIS